MSLSEAEISEALADVGSGELQTIPGVPGLHETPMGAANRALIALLEGGAESLAVESDLFPTLDLETVAEIVDAVVEVAEAPEVAVELTETEKAPRTRK